LEWQKEHLEAIAKPRCHRILSNGKKPIFSFHKKGKPFVGALNAIRLSKIHQMFNEA
jgi:hypothetical protein